MSKQSVAVYRMKTAPIQITWLDQDRGVFVEMWLNMRCFNMPDYAAHHWFYLTWDEFEEMSDLGINWLEQRAFEKAKANGELDK